ncbi:metallophosphoesterase [Asticcacaulis sp. MM231]|uniref:metallophosphoesterase n=1 Tax=Asticcacaulis sp. MM231 TaxID=3157666 RepID=UPI0032D59877
MRLIEEWPPAGRVSKAESLPVIGASRRGLGPLTGYWHDHSVDTSPKSTSEGWVLPFVKALFRPRQGVADAHQPQNPPEVLSKPSTIDRLTYAIGDIHGRYDLFALAIEYIRHDARALNERPRIVLLGDYIDRGPDSAQVLSAIIDLRAQDWCDTEVLLGNHELFMIKFALDTQSGAPWLNYGGLSTLASYGITPPADRNDPDAWQALQDELLVKIPRAHLQLLSHAHIYFIAGDYLFVHGGVAPGVPVEEQTVDTLLWIREAFLKSPRASEYVVVHGHSAKATADNHRWRIGVDTGAYATGVLSVMRLNGPERRLIQAKLSGVITPP